MARVPTSERLLSAAERLYGERGIDGVSLRQIAEAAGQRNPAAVQYHFGGKDALLRAVMEHRVEPANRRRLEMLEDIERTGRQRDLRALLAAAVQPLLDVDADGQFLRFLSSMQAKGALQGLLGDISEEYGASARRVGTYLYDALELPDPLRSNRIAVAFDFVLRALAEQQQRVHSGGTTLPMDVFVEDLILATEGFLTAPPPADAAARLATESASSR